MDKKKENIFDFGLFKRLFDYIKPYKLVFTGVFLAVILLSVFSIARPLILQHAIDDNITTQTLEGFLPYIILMLIVLILEVVCQLLFIFYASWLGQSVVKDIRVKLFNHMLKFKMKFTIPLLWEF